MMLLYKLMMSWAIASQLFFIIWVETGLRR